MKKNEANQTGEVVISAASPVELSRIRNLFIELKSPNVYASNIEDKIAILGAIEAAKKAGDGILVKLDEIGENLQKSLTDIQQEKVKLITGYDYEEVNTANGPGLVLKKDGEKYQEAKHKLEALNKKHTPKLEEIRTGEKELQDAYEKKFKEPASVVLPTIEKKKLKDISFQSLETAIEFKLLK